MKTEQKSLRVGAAVIAFACIVRFCGSGAAQDLTALFTDPTLSSILLYAGTGRVYHTPQPEHPVAAEPPNTEPAATEPVQAVFSETDAQFVSVTNYPGCTVDVPAMLQSSLSWNLTAEDPTVLIIHSHTCESYENTEGYTETAHYRTTDSQYNMVSIGRQLTKCLQEKGIGVIHDTTVHDYPSYNDAYTLSRATVESYLQQYPSLQLVLDIHRDAYEDSAGNQLSSTVTVDGQSVSRLMLVAGTNGYSEGHTNWRENLSMAVKLQAILEKTYPGLCRPLAIRSSAFNQDLSSGSLLIEVGTAGDTRQAALAAAQLLAEGIAQLASGAN